MAALYLHNALFTSEPPSPPPPSVSRRQLMTRTPHDRQFSSHSSVTLYASASEQSHPTEPLLHGESSAYRDLLALQPPYVSGSGTAWETALNLDAEPTSSNERRRLSDLSLRKKIRRLRWAAKSVLYLMGAWALFTTIRYAIAVTIYVSHDRQTILIVLTSVSAFTVAVVSASIVLSLFSRTLGWDISLRSSYITVQSLLACSTSISILGPAITNFVLVFLWRNASNATDSLRGRCSWDIDVAWSGTGGQCNAGHGRGWGFWLGGAIFRLILTITAVMTFHILSYKYILARKPGRRKHGRTHLHSVSYPSVPSTGSETLHSDRGFQVMVSTNHLPISLSRSGRQQSRSTEISESSHESSTTSTSGEQRPSRSSHSRSREPSQAHPHLRDGQTSATCFRNDSPTSSEEDLGIENATSRYGTPIRQTPGQYSLVPLDVPQPFPSSSSGSTAAYNGTAVTDEDLNSFVGRFRSIMNQITEETDAGIHLAQHDRPGYYTDYRSPSPNISAMAGQIAGDEDYFIVGGVVQRMPTIESLGSREVMSIATSSNRGDRSIHSLSRPPTRQTGSQPPSRSNSLSASIMLSPPSPLETSFGGAVSELGELQRPAGMHSSGTPHTSTKSSASGTFYTAASGAASTTTSSSGKSAHIT